MKQAKRPGAALLSAAAAALISVFVAGGMSRAAWAQSGISPPYAGHYMGHGSSWEKVLDDPLRKLTRRSETNFWFVVDRLGKIRGQGYISYSADLSALKWSVPVPSVGSIEAAVSGAAEKSTFKYEIVGTTDGDTLALTVVGEKNATIAAHTFEFVLTATVSTPAGAVVPGAEQSFQIIKIPAKGWSPFQGLTARLVRHPGGPFTAEAEKSGEIYSIAWQAIQVSAADRRHLADEVRRLREEIEALKKKLE